MGVVELVKLNGRRRSIEQMTEVMGLHVAASHQRFWVSGRVWLARRAPDVGALELVLLEGFVDVFVGLLCDAELAALGGCVADALEKVTVELTKVEADSEVYVVVGF